MLCSQRLTEMYGYEAGELVGAGGAEVFASEDQAQARQTFDRVRAEGVRNVELLMARKDGTRFAAELSATTVLDAAQKPKSVIAVVCDVSARKQLQARVVLGDRLTSMATLAAGVAQEINNPLAYILANLEAVSQQLKEHTQACAALVDPPLAGLSPEFLRTVAQLADAGEAVAEAIHGAERVREIVSDLEAVSRHDEEQLQPAVSPARSSPCRDLKATPGGQ